MPNPKAQAHKQKGNASFKAGNYADAVGHYTAAILADSTDYTFVLNRAAAYLKLGKNEDAERDCTRVLEMSAGVGNVKALFRRGQARVAVGMLEQGVQDLSQALEREPAGVDIREELRKARQLLEESRKKTSERPMALAMVRPPRRRVPIRIIDECGSVTSTDVTETLRHVSTRSLEQKSGTGAGIGNSAMMTDQNIATTSSSSSSSSSSSTRTLNFKDAKQARDNTKPSRLGGGGIFRASGENTLFIPPSTGVAPSSVTPHTHTEEKPKTRVVPVHPEKPPKTWFEFARAWDACALTAVRWGLVLSVRPASVPGLFKTSLEPALLVSILGVFREVLVCDTDAVKDNGDGDGDGDDVKRVREMVRAYMDAFGRVERFETIGMILSRGERALAREVWDMIGVGGDAREGVGRAWGAVWR